MTTKLEARIDAEFERRGVKPYVYHFNDHSRKEGGNPHRIWAFGGVTIATHNPNRATIEGLVLEEQRTCGIFYNAAKDTLAGLHKRGIYGIAICDNRDQFSRKRGRIIAKGRLLKQLKAAEQESRTEQGAGT
jgi:hypothetical protein